LWFAFSSLTKYFGIQPTPPEPLSTICCDLLSALWQSILESSTGVYINGYRFVVICFQLFDKVFWNPAALEMLPALPVLWFAFSSLTKYFGIQLPDPTSPEFTSCDLLSALWQSILESSEGDVFYSGSLVVICFQLFDKVFWNPAEHC